MKIATIGNGLIVHDFLTALAQVKKELPIECSVMIAARAHSVEATTALAQRFDIPRVVTTVDAILDDPSVDAVYIALPNALHYPCALRLLQAGKHVWCEKPLTANASQANALYDVAKTHRVQLVEMITTIHHPLMRTVEQLLPRCGKIPLITCQFSHVSSKINALEAGELPNVFNPQMAGGALMDMNIYNIHFVVNLWGLPKTISYRAITHPNGIDLGGTVILDYGDHYALCTSHKNIKAQNTIQIHGNQGLLVLEGGTNAFKQVTFTDAQGATVTQAPDEPRLCQEIRDAYHLWSSPSDGVYEQLRDHSLRVMALADQVRLDAGIQIP